MGNDKFRAAEFGLPAVAKREVVVALALIGIISAVTLPIVHMTAGDTGRFWLFFLTLAVLFGLQGTRIWDGVALRLNRLAVWLDRRGSFRSDPVVEAPKFALLRMAFGIFMIERGVYLLWYMFPEDWTSPLIAGIIIANLVAACLVAAGWFTQPALIYLIVLQWQPFDNVIGTSTLGNDIAAMLATLLILSNAGARLSVDQWLMGRGGMLGRVIAEGYYRGGLPATNTLQIAKLVMLVAYWCVCIYSLMMHLSEPAWMTGAAGPLLLTNNFMSRFYLDFEQFFELGGWAVLIGRMALWMMLPWYAFLLPLVLLGGVWRTYVIVWAILFFALSLFVLQLGWLAHFEFLFLMGLFWQGRMPSWLKAGSRRPQGIQGAEAAIGRSDPIGPIATHVCLLSLAYLAMIPAPFLGWSGLPVSGAVRTLMSDGASAADIYGITPINVFNAIDLRMAENWFTLTAVFDEGREELVPVFTEQGTRLAMHSSDRVYFGNTVRYRRGAIGKKECLFDQYPTMLHVLSDYFAELNPGVMHFSYRQFRQPLPRTLDLLAGRYVPQPVTVVCTVDFPPGYGPQSPAATDP